MLKRSFAVGFSAFEREDYADAIAVLAPLTGENERIGGSRAQHDLIEFTLLKSYLNTNRLEEARNMLKASMRGASCVPVLGVGKVRYSAMAKSDSSAQ